MPFANWNDLGLEMGLKAMDDQHHKLIDQMNKIFDLNNSKATKTQLVGELEALHRLTKQHFQDEEKYMESIRYAAIDTHKVIHNSLITQFEKLVGEFKANGTTLPDEFFSFLKVWLTAHIQGIDKKYVEHSRAAS